MNKTYFKAITLSITLALGTTSTIRTTIEELAETLSHSHHEKDVMLALYTYYLETDCGITDHKEQRKQTKPLRTLMDQQAQYSNYVFRSGTSYQHVPLACAAKICDINVIEKLMHHLQEALLLFSSRLLAPERLKCRTTTDRTRASLVLLTSVLAELQRIQEYVTNIRHRDFPAIDSLEKKIELRPQHAQEYVESARASVEQYEARQRSLLIGSAYHISCEDRKDFSHIIGHIPWESRPLHPNLDVLDPQDATITDSDALDCVLIQDSLRLIEKAEAKLAQ